MLLTSFLTKGGELLVMRDDLRGMFVRPVNLCPSDKAIILPATLIHLAGREIWRGKENDRPSKEEYK